MRLAGQPSFRQLQGSVPAIAANLTPLGALEADKRIKIEISLPLRNKVSLDALIEELYDPQSPKYRQYLTPAEFNAAFGPTDADLQSVVAFAVSNNLTIVNSTSDRRLLYVTAPVSTIEQLFQVSMLKYQHPSEPRTFYAPDREPLVPANLPILEIYGLSDFPTPHPVNSTNSVTMFGFDSLAPQPCGGSGANGAFMGYDFRHAYAPDVAYTGAGQRVGLLVFDGFFATDIAAYETKAGLPNVPITTVLLDGFNGVPVGAVGPGYPNPDIEVALDIENVISMAPGLSEVVVFEGYPLPGPFFPNDVLFAMANYSTTRINQFSTSYSWPGGHNGTTDLTCHTLMRTSECQTVVISTSELARVSQSKGGFQRRTRPCGR